MATSISSKPPVVLVTGCSLGGIGYALCEAFAARGCAVYATSRRLESMTSLTHPSIHCLEMDVTSDSSVKQCVEQIVHQAGRVDIAIANAGVPCFGKFNSDVLFAWCLNVYIEGPVLDIPIEDAKVVIDTNVLGVLRLAQAVFPHMASRKQGMFMTIASAVTYSVGVFERSYNLATISWIVLFQVVPWAGLYCASKAAVGSLTEALQMEARALSPDIRVTLVMAATVR
ncbi:unnamed protein product [Rhizoctonia solani]|uniref:NAD(P)-binding protein n=1 Tax=Rhizoctonia solani TaxID=456999 RepID=A0A8H3HIS8_9AGAM|nr:unnamed protein product [Rhizoctonia solani]